MGWLFVVFVHSSYLIRKSFVTVFCYSNTRNVFSALCLNYSHLNGLSVIQYRFNQSIFLYYDLVPLSLLTGNPPFPYYINNQYLYSWCLSALSRSSIYVSSHVKYFKDITHMSSASSHSNRVICKQSFMVKNTHFVSCS